MNGPYVRNDKVLPYNVTIWVFSFRNTKQCQLVYPSYLLLEVNKISIITSTMGNVNHVKDLKLLTLTQGRDPDP